MDQLTAADNQRYQKLLKAAANDPLGFRIEARQAADAYSRSVRRLLSRVNTRHTSTYLLLSEWQERIVPEITALDKAAKSATLRNTLAKQLHLSGAAAGDLAKGLSADRISQTYDAFLQLCYGRSGRSRRAANQLFDRPLEDIALIRGCFLDYYLTQEAAKNSHLTIYDSQAPLLKRLFQKLGDKRQTAKYCRQQEARLATIEQRQQQLKTAGNALIERIGRLSLDTVLALDAHRQYQKQLDKLRPASRTAAKRLALFTSSTKKIRQSHAGRHSDSTKLADLHQAEQELEAVLVELFDMTDNQRNHLMVELKEFRDLDREAAAIRKQLKN